MIYAVLFWPNLKQRVLCSRSFKNATKLTANSRNLKIAVSNSFLQWLILVYTKEYIIAHSAQFSGIICLYFARIFICAWPSERNPRVNRDLTALSCFVGNFVCRSRVTNMTMVSSEVMSDEFNV